MPVRNRRNANRVSTYWGPWLLAVFAMPPAAFGWLQGEQKTSDEMIRDSVREGAHACSITSAHRGFGSASTLPAANIERVPRGTVSRFGEEVTGVDDWKPLVAFSAGIDQPHTIIPPVLSRGRPGWRLYPGGA